MRSASDIILKIVCPALGVVVANIMFFAPFQDARRAVAKAELGDLNPTPWAFMTGNCLGWLTYAFLTSDLYIFFANSPGFILSVWLNMIAVKLKFENHRSSEMRKSFSVYLERESFRRQSLSLVVKSAEEQKQSEDEPPETGSHLQQAIDFGKVVWDVTSQSSPAPTSHENLVVVVIAIWLAVISTISIAHFNKKTNQFIIGLIVNLNLVFFYGAPLSTIWKVLASRNSASIHIPTMAANTANGAFWTAYGIAVADPFIYVPNGMGAGLGAIQVILIILFQRKDLQSEPKNAALGTVAVATATDDEAMVETESDRTSPVPTATNGTER